jgi:DNA-binding transcriptional regulator LsrR (DeoR family)
LREDDPTSTGQATSQHRDFIVEVAWLHHELGLDQQEIGHRFGVSRSTISRALSEALERGIVQVTVTEAPPLAGRLTSALRHRYAISAHVGQRVDGETSMHAVARETARLLERIVASGHVSIAASWGRTLALAAHMLRPRAIQDLTIVDAVGHARGEELAPAIDVTNTLAAALSTTVTHLHAPAFAGSIEALAGLIVKPRVRRALRLARAADVILVSVGVVGDASLLRQEGLITAEVMADLVRRGAEGEILGQYYDRSGRRVEAPSLSAVGLTLDDLRQGHRVIAAAGGAHKAASLRAAIAGGIVDEIVVDDELAIALLAEAPVGGGEE